MIWQPQEEGVREICSLLQKQISPNSDKPLIWYSQQLQNLSRLPDFNNYLAYIIARDQ
ncbi:hypothetical protein MKW92_029807, partial [Papaver armeniacum]